MRLLTQIFVREHSAEEIKEHVKGLIKIFNSDHTGFVFTTVHNIQVDIPPEKILAIYGTALLMNREKSEGG